MDTVKDIFSAISNRFRSKIVSSILLSFIAINWKVIFYVLFEPVGSEAKFAYFDANTSAITLYWLPIFLGLLIACITPWLTLLGQLISYHADRFRKKLVNNSNHEDLVDKLRYDGLLLEIKAQNEGILLEKQAQIERSLIEKAKRDVEVKEIADPEVRMKLEQDIEEEREEDDDGIIINADIPTKVHPGDFEIVDEEKDEAPFTLDEFEEKIEILDVEISRCENLLDSERHELDQMNEILESTKKQFDHDIDEIIEHERDTVSLRVEKVKQIREIQTEMDQKRLNIHQLEMDLLSLRNIRAALLYDFAEYYEEF